MGFRTGAYAKIWEVSPVADTATKLRMSISRKNKMTGEYEQEFSGFVMCVGTAAAAQAARLPAGARIKLGDCDVTTKYDKAKNTTYTNFKIFSFENLDEDRKPTAGPSYSDPQPQVDSGEIDENDHDLPF